MFCGVDGFGVELMRAQNLQALTSSFLPSQASQIKMPQTNHFLASPCTTVLCNSVLQNHFLWYLSKHQCEIL